MGICQSQSKTHTRLDKKISLKEHEIEFILENTNLTRDEIENLFNEFINNYPNGKLNKNEFKLMFRTFKNNKYNSKAINFIFNALDVEKTGEVDFKNVVCMFYELNHGSTLDQIRFIFKIYDLNGDGVINEKEIKQIIDLSYDLIDMPKKARKNSHSTDDLAKQFIYKYDVNEDGFVDLSEFIDGYFKNKNYSSQLFVYLDFLGEKFSLS